MLTETGPQLIEYNARFGDPECQVLMMRFEGDLVELLHAVATGTLAEQPAARFAASPALTVVMTAKGYPGTPETGGAVRGVEQAGATVFQAATRDDAGRCAPRADGCWR